MKIPLCRFLLPILVITALAGCGGATGQSSLPPRSNTLTPTTVGPGTQGQPVTGRRGAQAVATSGSYWSGTVSAVNGNGITANCQDHDNFGQYYSCIPVTYAAGAAISGTPVAGQYFQMWGDLSNLPNVTASTITYGSSPFPTTAPAPSGSYWSGTVSAVNGNGITANCQDHDNFGQYYSCIPVTYAAGAAVSGTPVAGQYFQMWGDLSNLPNVTASTITYGSSPFPTTASTASPGTTSSGTTSSTGTYMGFANGMDYPTSFTPYASMSIWRTKISADPTIASYSADVVQDQFPNSPTNAAIRATEAGQYDYNHPQFYATATNPLVTVNCTRYCGDPDNGGVPSQIRIPPGARPARGSDAHFDVVQPDGTEITMYDVSQPSSDWTDGSTVTAANVANCGSFSGGGGWLPSGPGPTAAGYCDDAGVVTAAELASGQINHAVLLTGECAVGTQYPVENYGSTAQCTSGVGPPLGGREWYDVPCSTTQANGALRPWEKAILCALNQYGGYLGDDQGGGWHFTGGIAPEFESEEPWLDANGQNYTSPFAALASQGWYPITVSDARSGGTGIRWVGAEPWQPSGVDFPDHIHWLSPCSAQGTC